MSHTVVIDPLTSILLAECANLRQAVAGWSGERARRGDGAQAGARERGPAEETRRGEPRAAGGGPDRR